MTALLDPADGPTVSVPVSASTTFLPRTDPATRPVPRTNLGALPLENRFLTWGARFAALALAWVITQRLLPWHGFGWFVVVFAVANVLLLAVGTATFDNTVAVSDRVAQWLVSTGAVVVFVALGSVIVYVFHKGWPALHHATFFLHDMSGVGAKDPLSKGGIQHAIVGSLIQLGIASAISLPLGVGTAVFMNEVGGRFAKVVRTVVEAMTALPDILAGLFIYTVWILAFGLPKSGMAAALAISVMMLPIIARASDVVLRVVPGTLREASYALGASRWSTVWNVVLPTAKSGLATALILAIARGIGETAPVMITSGNSPFLNVNPVNGVMSSLPLAIFEGARSGEDNQIQRAFGTAAVLLLLVLILFSTARYLARPPSTKPSTKQSALKRLLPRPATSRPTSHIPPAPDEEVP